MHPALIIFHSTFIILTLIQLFRSFSFKNRQKGSFIFQQNILIVLLFILLTLCFVNYRMSSFNGEHYFSLFSICTVFSAIAFLLLVAKLGFNIFIKNILLIAVSCLFWLSIFSAIKFTPYMPYVWFPLLGIYALTPLFFSILTFSEIRYQCNQSNHPLHSISLVLAFGLIFLFLIQVGLNVVTTKSWELIHLFNPANTFV